MTMALCKRPLLVAVQEHLFEIFANGQADAIGILTVWNKAQGD